MAASLAGGGAGHAAARDGKGRIVVASDGRSLRHEDGTPFFWLADTAWELFHRARLDEARSYIEDRAAKGFTVVQAVVLAERDGLRTPNPNGDLPLVDEDPTQLNEAYFRHVDAVVRLANAQGLHVAMLPAWGDKFNLKWGSGPEIFTPDNAYRFAALLARRYADDNVIWVLGGDRNPETARQRVIVESMANGIRSVAGDRQLITYHPLGLSRSWEFFRDSAWIDFHMFQSGHAERHYPNYRMTMDGRAIQPVKPVIDAEPRYEDHPVNWDETLGWFDDFDVRQAAWWSLLSGAAGHTYGHHSVWQMWQPGLQPASPTRIDWREALDRPGAAQMGYMRRLLEPRGFGSLRPAQHLLHSNPDGAEHQRAARSGEGRWTLVYSPYGVPVRLQPEEAERPGSALWFNPRTGSFDASPAVQAGGVFDPPGPIERGNDWVLVIDGGDRVP